MRQLVISKSITNRDGIVIESYLRDIKNIDFASTDEEIELTRKIKNGDQQALDRLTKANLRFVVSVAKQYQNQGLSLPDLINEGNLGLITAAQRFDETRGFKFISYAVWWIRQSIMKAISEYSRLVRIPCNKQIRASTFQRRFSEFEMMHERMPSLTELSDIMNIPVSKLHTGVALPYTHLSLDAPLVSEGEGGSLLDVLEDELTPRTDKNLHKQSLSIELQRAINILPYREQVIIKKKFGIGCAESSQGDIATELGLSCERVRQLRDEALEKLKNAKNNSQLREFLG